MTVQSVIMAVPWQVQREQRALALAHRIGATVVWDRHHDPMDTLARALDAFGDGPGILLEDDVVLHSRWEELTAEHIAAHPDSVIQFFNQRTGAAELTAGSRWEPASSFIANLCVYLPAGYAAGMRPSIDTWAQDHPEDPTACDFVPRYYLQSRKERYWMVSPSLVQHERWTSSINPRRPKNRVSRTFEEDA